MLSCSAFSKNQYYQTDLYLGLTTTAGKAITQTNFDKFIYSYVIPFFGDGFTLNTANGAWRNKVTGEVKFEKTNILTLVYPATIQNSNYIQRIARQYKKDFYQQAVLIVQKPVVATLLIN